MSAPQQYDITRIGIVSIDTSLGPTTYVLPNAPGSEQGLIIKDWNGHASTNPITIVGIVDGSSSFTFDQDFQSALLVFNGGDWSLVDTANGPAGGDLGGQFPNPIVKKINGNPLGSTTPTSGNLLIANGALWQTEPMTGDATITLSGAATVGRINGNPLGSTTPTSGNLLIANGSLWQTEPMTGDTTITLSGSVTVGRINGNPLGGTTPTSANILLANGTQWGSTAVSGDVTINSSGAVNVGKINGNLLGTTTPSSGNLLIGDGADWDSVAVSGDATINSAGAVNVAKINGASLGTTTATAAHILVADGANWQSVGMSGGATINSSGVVTLSGSLSPSGTAGGDLSGTYPNPAVSVTHLSAPLPIAQGGTGNSTGSPSGTAGGDLSGGFPSPTVAKINGTTLGTTTATAGNILVGDGANWQTRAVSGNGALSSTGVLTLTPRAHYQGAQSNPAGTASGTAVMMGLAGSITPATSGVIEIKASGSVSNSNSGGSFDVALLFGTGAAPTNGAALTGSSVGPDINGSTAAVNQKLPFAVSGITGGLSVGTTYWLDIAMDNGGGGTVTLHNVAISAVEL